MGRLVSAASLAGLVALLSGSVDVAAQGRYTDAAGSVRVALAKQPFSPNGTSRGPTTMADGGIRTILEDMGATVRVAEAAGAVAGVKASERQGT